MKDIKTKLKELKTTKPREFWIRRFEVDELLNSDYKFSQADISKSVPYPEHETESDYKDAYHVVEKRALDAANEEIKLLRKALEEISSEAHSSLCESMNPYRRNYKCHIEYSSEALKQSKER